MAVTYGPAPIRALGLSSKEHDRHAGSNRQLPTGSRAIQTGAERFSQDAILRLFPEDRLDSGAPALSGSEKVDNRQRSAPVVSVEVDCQGEDSLLPSGRSETRSQPGWICLDGVARGWRPERFVQRL